MSTYSLPKSRNGLVNTTFNSDDYIVNPNAIDVTNLVNLSSTQTIGGAKTLNGAVVTNLSLTNNGNTVIGDATADTCIINATTTINGPVDMRNASGISYIPGKFISSVPGNTTSLQIGSASTNMTGTGNTSYGISSQGVITTGSGNSGQGQNANYSLTTGSNNCAYGNSSLALNVSGSGNTTCGNSAGRVLTQSNNTVMGYNAYNNATTVNNNCVMGANAGLNVITGDNNVLIGYNAAGTGVTSATNCCYIGPNTSNLTNVTYSNSTCIGSGSLISASNQMVLGVSATSVTAPNLVGTGNRALYTDPNGVITISSSDARLKHNISYLDQSDSLSKVLLLKPAQWIWNKSGNKDYGVIAQDIQTVLPDLVFSTPNYDNVEYDVSNNIIPETIVDYLGVNYHLLTPYLINSIQELNQKITDQKTLIDSLLSVTSSLLARVTTLESTASV